MKKALIIFAVLVLSMSLMAQQRAGTIYGKIVDAEKNALPGVTVTLNGPEMAPLTTVTSETGNYRFPSIPPGQQYVIKAELQGFKSIVQGNIIVTVGASTEIDLTLEVGKLEEQITVTAASPVVDPKKTTTAMSVNKEEMQSLPTARDPWVVMQMAPAIMLDRENVGGNESGQQSSFIAKGDMANNGYVGSNNIWAVDGIDITDPAAQGGSALYYDFDMFEEMNITTGGAADVTVQTGGIALNMVTRRGGNKMSLAGRFYLTDNFFQSENLTQDLKNMGILNTNKIQQIKDYGFNAGGPLVKDKVWWWGAYGVQDIFVYTVYATQDKTLLNNYNFKLNAQVLANNRFEALVTSGAKEKFGRNASVAKPEGDHQQGKYHWGSPIIKLQDEHVFGNNLYLSLKYSFNDAGFGWKPMVDEGLGMPVVYDRTSAKYVAYGSLGFNSTSWGSYAASRPRNNYQLNATYFNDTFLGMSHEVKVGAEYSHKVAAHHWGTFQGFDINRNYNTAALDTDKNGSRTATEMVGSGWQRIGYWRDGRDNGIVNQTAFYLQDTISKGNFTITLGLRYDYQKGGQGAVTYGTGPGIASNPAPWNIFDSAVVSEMATILPGVSADPVGPNPQVLGGGSSPYHWETWSPRIGVTWDISGNGKTVLKLALSQYGDVMGTGYAAASPQGTGGSSMFWWMDGGYGLRANNTWGRLGTANGTVTLDELFWMYSSTTTIPGAVRYQPYQVFPGGTFDSVIAADLVANGYNSDPYKAGAVSGYDWNNKTFLDYSNITWWVDKKSTQSSTRTREVLMTLEREIFPDFAVALTGSWRRYDNFDMGMTYYPAEFNGEPTMYDGMIDPGGLDLTNLIIDPRTPPSNGPWYVEAGTLPSEFIQNFPLTNPADPASAPLYPWSTQYSSNVEIVNIGGSYYQQVTYSTLDSAGRPFFLPASYYPTTGTPYSITRKGNNWTEYMGLDLVFTKRLSNRWFMNASFTWQDTKNHWGTDWFDETDKWAYDGQPYGAWGGGASGKQSVLMYTRWMAKLAGLYQLPYGFDISGTINAREGWKIPHYYYFEIDPDFAPNSAYYGKWPTMQQDMKDSLPTFINVTLRLEKRINIGAGRLYFMADVFNVFNAATVNRAYEAWPGYTYWSEAGLAQTGSSPNTTYRRLNEILNPRVWRFGARFEF